MSDPTRDLKPVTTYKFSGDLALATGEVGERHAHIICPGPTMAARMIPMRGEVDLIACNRAIRVYQGAMWKLCVEPYKEPIWEEIKEALGDPTECLVTHHLSKDCATRIPRAAAPFDEWPFADAARKAGVDGARLDAGGAGVFALAFAIGAGYRSISIAGADYGLSTYSHQYRSLVYRTTSQLMRVANGLEVAVFSLNAKASPVTAAISERNLDVFRYAQEFASLGEPVE